MPYSRDDHSARLAIVWPIARCVWPTPGGPRKTTFFGVFDEGELVQTLHLLAAPRRLEGEIQLGEPFDGRSRLERIAAWNRRWSRSWIWRRRDGA